MTSSDLILIVRVLIGTVLVAASSSKVVETKTSLESSIMNYGVPEWAAPLVTVALPTVEGVLGVSVLLGTLMPFSALAASLLFLTFALITAINVSKGNRFPCACFGVSRDSLIGWNRVVLTLILAFVALLSSGWPWAHSWPWPFALAPNGQHVSSINATADSLVGVGGILAIMLIRASRSLPSFRIGGSRKDLVFSIISGGRR